MHTLTFNKEKLLTYISKIGSRISDQDTETTYHFDYKKCEELGVVIFILFPFLVENHKISIYF